MKLSASLPDEDVEFLDAYARSHRLDSRSSALRRAVRLLREAELGGDYADAWDEWNSAGEHEAWDRSVGDGLGPPTA